MKFFAIIFLLLVLAFPAVAANENTNGNLGNAFGQLKDKIQNRWNQHCENLESRINLQIIRYENNKDRHVTVYNRMIVRVESLLTKAEEHGYDVDQLKSDLLIWQEKIKAFASAHASYIDKLRATQEYACGESEGSFHDSWKETRESLRAVHQASLDARLFFQETIRPDLEALREQKVNTDN